ncbi:MAG: class I SAM-dependent methyltransferase [Bacteriovoracaceae bacterium]|nr:class I SAM-dependent methyltransferase [Bacteriovoracaceae bacterium]
MKTKHGRPPALAEINFKKYSDKLRGKCQKDIFNFINQYNIWGAISSNSGLGSELESTSIVRLNLPKLLKELEAESMLDLPCGDFSWMKEINLPLKKYIGGDIVNSIISNLKVKYSGERGNTLYDFKVLDIIQSKLPVVDVIFCRDCLVHFCYESVSCAISNLKNSGSKYLVTTTFTSLSSNVDIEDGDWRPINLEMPPFNFKKPINLINEKCTEVDGAYSDKSLGIWEISSLPDEMKDFASE